MRMHEANRKDEMEKFKKTNNNKKKKKKKKNNHKNLWKIHKRTLRNG